MTHKVTVLTLALGLACSVQPLAHAGAAPADASAEASAPRSIAQSASQSLLLNATDKAGKALQGANDLPGTVGQDPAAPGGSVLPDPGVVEQILLASPALQAADLQIGAAQAGARQLSIGPQEWSVSSAWARRQQAPVSAAGISGASTEWELGLERGVRWPGKRAVAEQLGTARVVSAQALWLKTWREQTRQLLESYGTWLREREVAQVWAEQISLLEQQATSVTRRQQLGDAARIEQLQAQAALTQAQAQALAAQSRRDAAQAGLQQWYPGLPLAPAERVPAPPPSSSTGDLAPELLRAALQRDPDLVATGRELEAQTAALAQERADQRPDPSVQVRYGRAQNGAERVVGIGASFPLGGAYREAGVQAIAARLAALSASKLALERRVAGELSIRWREQQGAYRSWQQSDAAANALERQAQALARGYQLGEGTLSEVLAARRLANEQRLSSAQARVDAWLGQWRVALESGNLWPAPRPLQN